MSYRSSIEVVGNNSDPDIVYYNADIVADAFDPRSLGLDKDPPIRFQETRSIPLINDISKYMFSIIRFTMDGAGKDLPIFIPSVNDNQADVNVTDYSVSMEYTIYYLDPATGADSNVSFTAQRFIYYQPETLFAPIPSPPNTVDSNGAYSGQDLRGRYYFVYTYQHWLDLCNKALNDCFYDDLLAVGDSAHPTKSITQQWKDYWLTLPNPDSFTVPVLQGTPPVMYYNQASGLFSIWGDTYCFGDVPTGLNTIAPYVNRPTPNTWSKPAGGATYYAVSGEAPKQGSEVCRLFFNTNMMGLFDNFPNYYYGIETPYGLTNQILFQPLDGGANIKNAQALDAFVSDPAGTNPTVAPTPKKYIVMTQNYNSTSTLWNPISSIVFSSTMIPIFPEQTGTPLLYGAGNNNAPNESTSSFAPIITDIAIAMERAEDYRGFLSYTPTGEYRLSSFTGSRAELRNIDIQVFWKNRINNILYPITMFNLSSVSIKMMFRKK